MFPRKSQWSLRADGMPEPMPPSAFAKPTPTPTLTPKYRPGTPGPLPGKPNPPSKQPGASIDGGNKNTFVPQGSGASASFGGGMSGGSGSILGML